MKKTNEVSEKTTAISDFPTAIFLYVRGTPLLSIQRNGNSNRFSFIFPETEEVRKLQMEYLNDGLVSARAFYNAFKDLKRRVYELQGRD